MASDWHTLVTRLRQRGALATRPHPLVDDEVSQLNVRLLASVVLVVLPLHIFTAVGLFAAFGPMIRSGRLVLASMVATLLVYLVSRTRHAEAAVNLFIIELYVLAMALLYINADAYSAVTALLPICTASMFRSVKRLVVTATITTVSVFVMSRLRPGNWDEIFGILMLLGITTIVVIIRTNSLSRAETQLRRRNQQLAESEARFRAAIDAGVGVFFLLKAVRNAEGAVEDFVVVDSNARALEQTHLPYEAMIGKRMSLLVPSSYQQQLLNQCRQVVESRISLMNETLMNRDRWWEYQIVPVGDGVAISANDITERKNAESRQIQFQMERERFTMLRKFINDVSHDLMTPLSIINTNAYLARKIPRRDGQEQHLSRIDEQVARLREMINDMLNQSRLGQLTQNDLKFESVDLNDLLQKLITAFEPVAHKKRQQLVFQACDRPALMSIDETRLKVALSNLVDNALRYTSDSGTIVVSCQDGQDEIAIEVLDDGPGIPHESVRHVFESFYRVEQHRPQNAGTGLGLPITKKIVELHGGTVEARNRPVGGMSFCVRLPKRTSENNGYDAISG